MQELLKTTKADRKDMIRDHQKEIGSHESEIKELKSQADDIKRTSRKLSEENAEKLSRRKIVDKKIGNIKGASNALFLLGAVGIAAGAILIFAVGGVWPIVGGIAAALAGIASIVFGFMVRPKWKQYAQEQSEAYEALKSYDKLQKDYAQHIKTIHSDIADHEAKIEEAEAAIGDIQDFDKYETYYRWVDKTQSGHVVVMVTGSANSLDGKPTAPKEGKRHKDSMAVVNAVEISLDKTPCCSEVPCNLGKQSGAFCIVPIKGSDCQALRVRISYRSEDSTLERTSDPIAVTENDNSIYIWYHVFAGKNGSQVYTRTYEYFEEFRDAIALTKEDIMQII